MTAPVVCVYAIMRNEAVNVERWLRTTSDADHRVVLDTGSTDGTDALLKTAGGVDVHLSSFEPFHFGDARTAALALCPPNVDLCLRLDADETLGDEWRARLVDVYNPIYACYRYPVINHGRGWGVVMRDDCHRRFGFRWRYPTHEILQAIDPTWAHAWHEVGFHVDHWPPDEHRPHHGTNLKVLEQAALDEPHDKRMAFYYARELWYQGQWGDARRAFLAFLDMPYGWRPERAEACRIMAQIVDDPEPWLWRAVGESPARREPWVDLARLYARQDRWDEARTMIEMADRKTDPTIYTTTQDCWDHRYNALRESVLCDDSA